jgi:hypothetical protein
LSLSSRRQSRRRDSPESRAETALHELARLCKKSGGEVAQRLLSAANAHAEALLVLRLCVAAPADNTDALDVVGSAALRFLDRIRASVRLQSTAVAATHRLSCSPPSSSGRRCRR